MPESSTALQQKRAILTKNISCPISRTPPEWDKRCGVCVGGNGIDPKLIEKYIDSLLGLISYPQSPLCAGLSRMEPAAMKKAGINT